MTVISLTVTSAEVVAPLAVTVANVSDSAVRYPERSGGVRVKTPVELLYVSVPVPDAAAVAALMLVRVI